MTITCLREFASPAGMAQMMKTNLNTIPGSEMSHRMCNNRYSVTTNTLQSLRSIRDSSASRQPLDWQHFCRSAIWRLLYRENITAVLF